MKNGVILLNYLMNLLQWKEKDKLIKRHWIYIRVLPPERMEYLKHPSGGELWRTFRDKKKWKSFGLKSILKIWLMMKSENYWKIYIHIDRILLIEERIHLIGIRMESKKFFHKETKYKKQELEEIEIEVSDVLNYTLISFYSKSNNY